jgi:hypothetical protein
MQNGRNTWHPRQCATLRKQAQKLFVELEIRCSIQADPEREDNIWRRAMQISILTKF